MEVESSSVSSKVILVTSDGNVEASRDVLKLSKLANEMLVDDDDSGAPEIPLPNVNSATMKKVLEYLAYHKTNPVPEISKPIKSADPKVFLKDFPWDETFIDIEDQTMFFDVILAANYLDIESLLDLGCAKLASILKNKTPQEIRTHFNIPTPTPEEEEAIKAANQWIFDVRPVDAPPVQAAPAPAVP